MELFKFYTIDECVNIKLVKNKLTDLEDDGKITFSIERDILKIKDLDLDENEVIKLTEIFDNNEIYPYMDYEEDIDDPSYLDDDFDDDGDKNY